MTETNLVTKDTVGNFNMMSKVMGISTEGDNSDSKTSTLARVKIIHAPIMGIKTIDGEETETVVVKALALILFRCLMIRLSTHLNYQYALLCRGLCIRGMCNLLIQIHHDILSRLRWQII